MTPTAGYIQRKWKATAQGEIIGRANPPIFEQAPDNFRFQPQTGLEPDHAVVRLLGDELVS
jgi:hypothetical protein